MDIQKILELVSKVIKLEEKIEEEIKKEKDLAKRKKLMAILKKRDSAAFRNLLFK